MGPVRGLGQFPRFHPFNFPNIMMETRSISQGNLLFQMELPAFERLGAYLDALRLALRGSDGADDIVKEVEYRMAELFQDALAGASRALQLEDVERICAQLGDPSDFQEAPDSEDADPGRRRAGDEGQQRGRRRWYRDPDERVLAGVASGIAYRFGVDPIFIRALFIALFVFTGTGVLFYPILAAIMPVAKTASDRLAMKGDPVTLESIIYSMESQIRSRRNGQTQRPWVQRWRNFVSQTLPEALQALGKGVLWTLLAIAILSVLVLGAFILSTAVGFNGLF
jgi:phage shock protein PspC (stress-responsive transcriptional regulator)